MRTLIQLVFALLLTNSIAHAELVTINVTENQLWIFPDGYREELAELQDSNTVCDIQLPTYQVGLLTGPKTADFLSDEQVALIHKVHMQLLYDAQFREHVGALIEQDAYDINNHVVVPTEFGGVGLDNHGQIELLPIPSDGRLHLRSAGRDEDMYSNGFYDYAGWASELIPHVFEWHMHSRSIPDGEDLCYPSADYSEKHGWKFDVGHAITVMEHNNARGGQSHHFLFAKVGAQRKVSTVYYGAVRNYFGTMSIVFIALPIVEY